MDGSIISPRKLIEVALPLDSINEACAREKAIRHGHPSSLHLWWARRPLAAARAVIFAQLINDPASLWEAQNPGQKPNPQQRAAFTRRRKELFDLIKELVLWENSNNEGVLERARGEILRAWQEVCTLNSNHPKARELFDPSRQPAFHDPFAGGGAIPLEAQRLGLDAYASDLNPVAVIINKAMIEIPPKFADRSPVSLSGTTAVNSCVSMFTAAEQKSEWAGSRGLAEDVRFYGLWMRNEAEKRMAALYPPVEITAEMARERPDLKLLVGRKLPVIAWLWARTVKSPHPAFSDVAVPLASSFVLSRKTGKEAYVQPVVEGGSYRFVVHVGQPSAELDQGTKSEGRGANFRCLVSGAVISGDYIKAEGQAGRLGQRLMAVVVEGDRGRVYLPPSDILEAVCGKANPVWRPGGAIPARLTGGTCVPYGLKEWGDLFTPRQLVALTTFSDLIGEVQNLVIRDAIAAGLPDDSRGLDAGGTGARAYAEAISVYLAFALDKMADLGNSLVRWEPIAQCPRQLFGRQSIPMIWDFAEANPLGDSSGGWTVFVDGLSKALGKTFEHTRGWFRGTSLQADAQSQSISQGKIISSDPPYYDNIAYADLSDFFYVWLRRSLRSVYPGLCSTIVVPKTEELVATAYRHGGKEEAEAFFLEGMTCAMRGIANQAHPEGPITIYYAFKQSETNSETGTTSTGWVAFLEAVHQAGLQLAGTWPMRTENASRMIGQGTNSLASSIVLVCRKRPHDARTISRREFIRELNGVLPEALDEMTKGSGDERSPVAPVDLAQAIIGPGMAVYSKYVAVLEADGSHMSIRTALQLINRFLAEDDFESDTQFCLHWFEQTGWSEAPFGQADVLARSKSTSVQGLAEAGVVMSGSGRVRLLRWNEYPADWDPRTDKRTPVWEALHQLIRALRQGGESAAGVLLAALSGKTEAVRQLAYRLYTLCERQGWAEDARAYNELITSWSAIEAVAAVAAKTEAQIDLFGDKI